MMRWQLWMMAAAVLAILEISLPFADFFLACLAVGAFLASLVSLWQPEVWWLPWGVFCVASVALTALAIPLRRRFHRGPTKPSNVDALVGEKAWVVEPIEVPGGGLVKVHGQMWRARSSVLIPKDTWVMVDRVEGTHLIVTLLKEV